jgi:hypothetical protein
MSTSLASYLGKPVSVLLEDSPFKSWSVKKSVRDDLVERIFHYVFPKHGLELRCDKDEKVSTIFIDSDELIGGDALELSLASARSEVLSCLGTPSKSGARLRDPILGDYGAWDRFLKPGYAIHVEYRLDVDRVNKITLMRDDVVP